MSVVKIAEFGWETDSPRGGVPGYGNVAADRWAICTPYFSNGVVVPQITFSDLPAVHPVEAVQWIVLSDGGQYAWLGQDSGLLYQNSPVTPFQTADGRTVKGYGQFSIVYVGETLHSFEDVDTYRQTQGGWHYALDGRIVTVAETIGTAQFGIRNYVQFPEFLIGQGQDDGIVVQITGEAGRRVLATGEWMNPQAAKNADGSFLFLAVSYQQHRTCVWQFTVDDLLTLPPQSAPDVSFQFTHPVLVAPFKDPDHAVPVHYRMEDGSLGLYTEAIDPLITIAAASLQGKRALIAHDTAASWQVPLDVLRPWDVLFLECYLVKGETLAQSVARWKQQMRALLDACRNDVGVIPMFYCQGGAPPDELWTITEVLDGLRHLSDVVNVSPRVKVVAPFAYERANGITAHPELQRALTVLIAASNADAVTLTPIGDPLPTPKPVPPPTPPPAPVEEEPMADLTPDQKNEVCDALGALVFAAFPGRVSTPASASQGVRQAMDQGVVDVPTLMMMSLAREEAHGNNAYIGIVERAAAAGRLLQGR